MGEKRILGASQDLEYSVLGKRKVYSSCKKRSEYLELHKTGARRREVRKRGTLSQGRRPGEAEPGSRKIATAIYA